MAIARKKNKKSQWTEKTLWRTAVLQFVLHTRIKGGDVRSYLKYGGNRLKEQEKAKRGVSGIGQRVKQRDTYFFYTSFTEDS